MKTLAYLDAGSGSIMLQAVLGGLAGLAVVLKMFGHKLKRTLLFWRKDTPASDWVQDVPDDTASPSSTTSNV